MIKKLLQTLQLLCQYSQVLHLQVNTFSQYWLNTRKYYHNTCKHWAGEYTIDKIEILVLSEYLQEYHFNFT